MNIKIILLFISTLTIFSCFLSNSDDKNITFKKIDLNPNDLTSNIKSKIFWYWKDDFSDLEKDKIKTWLINIVEAKEKVLGVFPFDIHIFLHLREGADEPVPWAYTDRYGQESIHFYIDPVFELKDFMEDWTAPHEISHLSLPFLGKKNSWFAEGFATYMQCQIMCEMGIMTEGEVIEKYKNKISRIKKEFYKNKPFVQIVDSLKNNHNYPAMYWGSVNFFIETDKELNKLNRKGINNLIKEYQYCCRKNDNNMDELISSLDSLIGSSICKNLLNNYTDKPAIDLFKK